jgi:hypothetical protein
MVTPTLWIRLRNDRAANIDRPLVHRLAAMVAVVQLVEHQVVILDVAGSSPVSHPDMTQSPGKSPGLFVISVAGRFP